QGTISERHRHRFEVSNKFRDEIGAKGMIFSGYCRDPRLSGKGGLVEMIELREHPYFVGCQFHPEFKSKPLAPHPLFSSFVAAAFQNRLQTETVLEQMPETEAATMDRAAAASEN